MKIGRHINTILNRFGCSIVRSSAARIHPASAFHSLDYLRHNARRLEHLSSLRIPVAGLSVLELGAGIGDHSHYYFDRACKLTITEVREENLRYLRERYPGADIRSLDVENADPLGEVFDVVHCYGLLYHLRDPQRALAYIADHCGRILFLETCVSPGQHEAENPTRESLRGPTQALYGVGCLPTRTWLFKELERHFEYVYVPRTQPNHEEFPLDWTSAHDDQRPARAVFIASRYAIESEVLSSDLLDEQARHE